MSQQTRFPLLQVNEETAISFDGMDIKRHDTQPPIVDKKGVPYDLNDPEFPVIKDHKFKVNYWAMPKTPAFMLKYLTEHWEYFNKTRFHGALKAPSIVLLKDVSAITMKLRGRYSYYDRILSMSPNLFNSPHEGWVNRILIHEMCHQYVFDVHGETEMKKEKGHGPIWKETMRMAKLPPSRFDDTSNEVYMDKKELKKHAPVINFRNKHAELVSTHPRIIKPYPYQFIKFANSKGGETCGMVTLKDSGDMWYVVVSIDSAYLSLSSINMFEPTKDDLKDMPFAMWVATAQRLEGILKNVR